MVPSLTDQLLPVLRYFISGFSHILPGGLDHILLILGLFFLSRGFVVLLFQMTLFTLGHSLTLGLSSYGVVSLPIILVEIAIALSISFIAIENLLVNDRLRAWRPWVVFGFGLIHGLGFAHSFSETLPIAPADFLPAIFSFNLGIEAGQLAVIAIALGITSLWTRHCGDFRTLARPASWLIAAAGIFLAVQRGG